MQNVSSQNHARFGQAADAPGFVSTDDLPPRKKPVLLAVYPIPDQTGANKANPDFAEISKAMPQGPEALLMEILKEVGGGTWFTLVERSNTGSLLNERQIREAQEVQRRQRVHINAERGRIAQEAVQIDQEVSQLRQQVLQEYSKLDANNLPPDVPTREQTLSNLEACAKAARRDQTRKAVFAIRGGKGSARSGHRGIYCLGIHRGLRGGFIFQRNGVAPVQCRRVRRVSPRQSDNQP